MGILGSLGDIGSILGGFSGASKEKSFLNDAMNAQEGALKRMLELHAAGVGKSEELFGLAKQQLDAVGPAMRQELLAQGKQAQAAQTASSLGSGLTGTTAYQSFIRGALADTGRNLATLEGGLADARSRLYERRAGDVYQQMIDRVNIRQRTKYDPFLQNFQSGQMAGAGAQAGGGLGGLLGDVLGSIF